MKGKGRITMKKLIALLVCVTLLLVHAVTVFAAETTTVEIVSAVSEAKPGDTITFDVQIKGSEKATSFGIALQYDKTVFEVVEGKCGLENSMISVFDEEKGFGYLFQEPVAPEGAMGTFTMKVKEGAVNGTFEVSGKLAVKKGNETIPSAVTPANITIQGGATSQPTTQPAVQPGASSATVQQTEAARTEPPQVEPQAEEDSVQPENNVTVETTVTTRPAAETQENLENSQQVQTETESEPLTGSEETNVTAELLIAVGVLIALIAALIFCLKKLSKKKKHKKTEKTE